MNGYPMSFDSLYDEAKFAIRMDAIDDLTPRMRGSRNWTVKDGTAMLQAGDAHGCRDVIVPSFGCRWTPNGLSLIRFHDEDLGDRVRLSTLRALSVPPERIRSIEVVPGRSATTNVLAASA
jgi:hypothetical protein